MPDGNLMELVNLTCQRCGTTNLDPAENEKWRIQAEVGVREDGRYFVRKALLVLCPRCSAMLKALDS